MPDGYYEIAESDELTEAWDRFERLPEPGENAALDAFCARKHVTIPSLVKLGARMSDYSVLAFAYPGGLKFRDVITDKRWAFETSEFTRLKFVHAGAQRASIAIVAEGETDAARLTMLYPTADIAVLPAGANPGRHAAAYGAQLGVYELVLMAHDHGHAGDTGAAALQEHVSTKTLRWLAPIEAIDNTGWGDVVDASVVPPLPDPTQVRQPVEQRLIVSARELLSLEPPEIDSHFDQALLPVTGSLILHGAMKSFKSFMALDMAAALAQSQPWCHFEATTEPQRVCVMQFEIPYAYFRQRVTMMRAAATEPELFDENFNIWTPLSRPRFVAGNDAAEAGVIKALQDEGISVLVFDPIRRGTGAADLNSEKEVRPILHFFQRCNDEGITVVATHHDNKAGSRSGGGSPLDMTGSGAFGGDADTVISVVIPKGYELESPERNLSFILRNGPSPSKRSMRMGDWIEYAMEPVGERDEESDADPTPGSERPPI